MGSGQMRSGSLKTILTDGNYSVFLLDASGVLYNDDGPVDGISKVVDLLSSMGKVVLATNNSSQSPQSIVCNLKTMGLYFDDSQVLSSGLGLLYDPVISPMICHKRCFVVGYTDSFYYVRHAGGKVVSRLEDAESIVLTASVAPQISDDCVELLRFCHHHSEIPVICCNPDRYVRGVGQTRVSVIGYYAHLLELEIKNPFYWVGKPHPNYSHFIRRILLDQGITLGSHTLFFDDNPHNVITMQNELNVIGCLVKETGISQGISLADRALNDLGLDWCIPALSL